MVEKVYGEQASQFLKERPELEIDDIPNFDIFEENIINTIGYGGVHTYLTYYMYSSRVITKLAHNPQLLEDYKEYDKLVTSYYPPSAIGLEDKLNIFDYYNKLITATIRSGKSEELQENLLLFIRDRESIEELLNKYKEDIKGYEKVIEKMNISTSDELANYKITRNTVLNDLIESLPNIRGEIIQLKYFGFVRNVPGQYEYYSHKKFLSDYLKFNSSDFNEDEIDLIELYSIIEDINDSETLSEINQALDGRQDVINPLHMKKINDKVVESYKREYLESLLTIEEAKKMVADPQSKAKMYIYRPNGDIVYEDHIFTEKGDKYYRDHQELEYGKVQIYKYDCYGGTKKTIRKEQSGLEVTTYENNEFLIKSVDGKIIEYSFFGYNHDLDKKYKLKIEFDLPTESFGMSKTTILYQEDNNPEQEFEWEVYYDELELKYFDFEIIDFQSKNELFKKSYYKQGSKENIFYYQQIKQYVDSIRRIDLEKMVKDIEDSKLMPLLDEEQFKKREGDIEVYKLGFVDSRKLCISAIRDGVTSEQLSKKSLFQGKLEPGLEYKMSEGEKIFIQKYLEGGIASRSFYYNIETQVIKVGLAYVDVNPNAIIGFTEVDGRVTHALKQLRVAFDTRTSAISDILDKSTNWTAELAMLRYEYDISRIKENTLGGRYEPSYIFAREGYAGRTAMKWAIEFSKPLIIAWPLQKAQTKEADKRKRVAGQLVQDIKQQIEPGKSR